MPDIAALARARGLSEAAARALAEAIRRGGGMAQFSHPELGGMGQWSRGMLMIGAMDDHALKARVADLAEALAAELPCGPAAPIEGDQGWWPGHLGRPASTGAQDGVRYAVFPDDRRIAVDDNGRVVLYDTGDRRLTGVSQQRSAVRSLSFSGPDGVVAVADLPQA